MELDPTTTNPTLYRVVMENDHVRVLEYRDAPGDRTTPHEHPQSVMITLSAFRRHLVSGDQARDVEMETGLVRWMDAQQHYGENTGDTPTHVIFVELKGVAAERDSRLGPAEDQGAE